MSTCLASTGSDLLWMLASGLVAVALGVVAIRSARSRKAMLVGALLVGIVTMGALNTAKPAGAACTSISPATVPVSSSPGSTSSSTAVTTTTTTNISTASTLTGVITGLPYPGDAGNYWSSIPGTALPPSTWLASITATNGSTTMYGTFGSTLTHAATSFPDGFSGQTTFSIPGLEPGNWSITITYALANYDTGHPSSNEPYYDFQVGQWFPPQFTVDGGANLATSVDALDFGASCTTGTTTASPIAIAAHSTPTAVLSLYLLMPGSC